MKKKRRLPRLTPEKRKLVHAPRDPLSLNDDSRGVNPRAYEEGWNR